MLIFLSCAQNKKEQGVSEYKMKDYLEVAEYFEEAEKVYQATSVANFPYIIEIKKGNKQLTFVGTAHTRDITHQADTMEQAFYRLKPQIAFNEGGQVDAGKTYADRDEAIIEDGETGHLKYLSDSLGIEVLNGDLDLATEVHALFEKHDRKAFCFISLTNASLIYMLKTGLIPPQDLKHLPNRVHRLFARWRV